MILEALVRHYDHLAADPESGVAPFGFSRQQVGFAVVLNEDGSMFAIEPRVDETSGKPRPVSMVVPHPGGKRTSGIAPYFLWDKTAYVLGRDLNEEAKGAKKIDRLVKQFEAFRDLHRQFAAVCEHPVLTAIVRFLDGWNPREHEPIADFETISGGNMVFMLRNEERYAHEVPAIRDAWLGSLVQTEDSVVGRCLVTQQEEPIARTHPPIKGVRDPGGQAEKSIVSFNLPAFDSLGKEQSYNAPVSQRAAFAYATALNRLLADAEHRVQLGDTTCVFWTDAAEAQVSDAVAEALGVFLPKDAGAGDDGGTRSALADFLERFRTGQTGADTRKLADPSAPFYILGLAPNAARISVRFWHECSIQTMAQRLQMHISEREIVPDRPDPRPLTAWLLLRETAREAKDIPPRLGGEYARAILMGTPYPDAMAAAVRRRVVADRTVNHARAAILKAWLNRNHSPHIPEVPVALDPNRTDTAYLLGRLFAVYEKIQKDALGEKLNRTIRDSYFASASATPAGVFPRLFKLSQHHLSKLRRDNAGLAVVREKLLGDLYAHLADFPRHLSLPHQGLFAIGYYQQMQDFYKRKATNDSTPSEEQTENA